MSTKPLFARRVLPVIVGLAIVSFLLAFIVSAYGDKLAPPASFRSDGFSRSAFGHSAWVEWMEQESPELLLRRDRGATPPLDAALVTLEPRVRTQDRFSEDLLELAGHSIFVGRPWLIAAPKWSGLPSLERRGWAGSAALRDLETFQDGFNDFMEIDLGMPRVVFTREGGDGDQRILCDGRDGDSFELFTRQAQFVELDVDWIPWLSCEGRVMIAEQPELGLWLVADPEPFSNSALARGDNAEMLLELYRALEVETLWVDETLHGHAYDDSLLARWFRFPMGLAFLQALLVIGLIAWAGGRRFGYRPRFAEERIDGRRVLIDNAARLLTLGLHSRSALLDYFDQTVRDVADRFSVRRDATLEALVRHLQPLTTARGLELELADLYRTIEALPSSGRISADRVTEIARRLHRWRTEMIHGNPTDR